MLGETAGSVQRTRILRLAGWITAVLLAGCGGSSPAPAAKDGGTPCQGDQDCPTGYACAGGFCQPAQPVDAAVDAAGPPVIFVNPTILTFGNPYVGGEYSLSFTIENVGASALVVNQLQLVDNTSNKDFSVTHPQTPFSLDPQASQVITVTLRPTDNGIPSGVIHVVSNDPTATDVLVQLTATVKDDARLSVCVLTGQSVADGCTTSPTDGSPLIDLGSIPYGQSGSRVVSLMNGGSGSVAEKIAAVAFASTLPLDHYHLDLYTVDSAGVETPATLPFYLTPVDPSGQVAQNELRARVTFTATDVDGAISGVSLKVTSDHEGQPTVIPVVGQILGCKPAVVDGGVPPDGGADPLSDPNNCGYCGHVCSLPHSAQACVGGVCQVPDGGCEQNWGDCDPISPGCESNLLSDPNNCGRCGHPCLNNHSSNSCVNGQCSPNCNSGYDVCGGDPAQGCAVNIYGDPNNCGACGHVCTNANGGAGCTSGRCTPNCATGFADCDGNPDNGCETPTTTTTDCGGCGHQCQAVNTSATACVNSRCAPTCVSLYGDCDSNPDNGCETSLTTGTNCGHCGTACAPANATGDCSTGTCTVVSCSSGYADCDGQATNGCEVNTTSDANHCGLCTTNCGALAHVSTVSCVTSACVINSCASGWGDCDGQAATGCETDLTTTATHCGACTTDCTQLPHVQNVSCTSSACTVGSCQTGWGNCDGQATNGCETDLTSTATHCGACATDCTKLPNVASATCTNSGCFITQCATGYADCDGNSANGCEVNTTTDALHCGGCNTNCTALPNVGTATCQSSQCVINSCAGTFANCDGQSGNGCEVDLSSSTTHCGSCTSSCAALPHVGTVSCAAATCVIGSCANGWGNCDGLPGNGCEVDLTSTTTHCGACATNCQALPNVNSGSAACSASQCTFSCMAGWGNCDGQWPNGCETSLTTTTNCGTCGTGCSVANGTATCATGSCQIASCASGYRDCNGSPGDGCETHIAADINNCGACGTRCGVNVVYPNVSSYGCSGGSCTVAGCVGSYYDVDGLPGDGCECHDSDSGFHVCTAGQALGTVDDNNANGAGGTGLTATGNIPYAGGEVWYSFTANNSRYASLSSNPFNVKIYFSTNPNDDFQLEVFTDCSGTGADCPDGGSPIHGTISTPDLWEFNATGEKPCLTYNSPGYNLCTNHARTYYLKVTRRTAPTCDNFTIQITNGV
jgi:hypothetical protein